jgi:catechol 2,3-dioxygenase-like lactoylglutathione lyase family enzyme
MLKCDALAGAVVEVRDLNRTAEFYDLLYATRRRIPASSLSSPGSASVGYVWREQMVRFVQVENPRIADDGGQHIAHRISAEHFSETTDGLSAAGHAVDWWHEDHPSERTLTAYVLDPSGNRVQLVPGDSEAPLLDHVVIETHDLELAEVFWTRVLGGTIDYYHGRRSRDYSEAVAWGEGSDRCAPWTRLWPGKGVVSAQREPQRRSAHPNQQLFVRFGADRVGLVLAPLHRQEPREEQVTGTPTVVLRTPQTVDQAVAALERRAVDLRPEERLRIPWVQNAASISLRDPAGNFVEVQCARS